MIIYVLREATEAKNVFLGKDTKFMLGDSKELEAETILVILKDKKPLPVLPAGTKVFRLGQIGIDVVFQIIECPTPPPKGKIFAVKHEVWENNFCLESA